MPAITILPVNVQSGELSISLVGSESLEFDVVLDPKMNVRFAGDEREFPQNGVALIIRGFKFSEAGNRIVDEFRYEESYTDDETGEEVRERFRVFLFMEEAAFDRLTERIHCGLPKLHLFFDLSSQTITFMPGGSAEDLFIQPVPRPWEQITSATLIQKPWGSGAS
jgi:hypothetical protein